MFIMLNNGKILLSILILSVLVLPGCSFFSGEYKTPKTYVPTDEDKQSSFSEGTKNLEEKLTDIAKGYKTPGSVENAGAEPTEQAVQSSGAEKNMPVVIEKGKNYKAVLHTEAGDIEIILTAEKTPLTVNNFVFLSKQNFYNNTVFHRVIDGFMIQGGDPRGDGTGGPGYTFPDEPFDGEYSRGTVAMANSGPNTNGSQFFIMHKDVPLQKNYVIFGRVTKGLDVVDKIAEAPVEQNMSGEYSDPINPVKINSIDISEY